MTDAQIVETTLAEFGPLSDYGIYHAAKAKGFKMTPSSARTRRSELVAAGRVEDAGTTERSSTGRNAKQWRLAKKKGKGGRGC